MKKKMKIFRKIDADAPVLEDHKKAKGRPIT